MFLKLKVSDIQIAQLAKNLDALLILLGKFSYFVHQWQISTHYYSLQENDIFLC